MEKISVNIKCEYRNNPMGIDNKNPMFSWTIQSDIRGLEQTSFELFLAENKEELLNRENLIWYLNCKSKEVRAVYQGDKLCSRKTYYWKVSITLNNGTVAESPVGYFEMAFLEKDCWKAKWINFLQEKIKKQVPELDEEGNARPVELEIMEMEPVYQARKSFHVKKSVNKARIYATAHGVYRLILDNVKVGDYELSPEHTQYENQLLYQVYDVTKELTVGEHVIGAIVAHGWYAGRIGFAGDNCQYGDKLSLLMQMEIEYADGTIEVVCSDENFMVAKSPYIYADLFVGEKYDARQELEGFFLPGYDESELYHALSGEEAFDKLCAHYGSYIKVVEKIKPRCYFEDENGDFILDFGQTIAGKVKAQIKAERNTEIRFEHSEIIGEDRKFIQNIRDAYKNQTDIYICKGNEVETYEPIFTYHGFRYVKVHGLKKVNPEDFTACVIASDIKKSGEFSCSDSRLNQLQKNIFRSQQSNMISIPTDCPQREKAGWTGDVQIFAATACYNMDMEDFFRRWLKDVRFEQLEDGQVPIIVPFLDGYKRVFEGIYSSAGWSDVAVILPWILYQYYGDIQILKDNFEMMHRWVQYIRETAENENPEELKNCTNERTEYLKYIWNTNFHFGDWLTPSVSINTETGVVDMMQSAYRTMEIVPTLFYIYSTDLMKKISEILGYHNQKAYYENLCKKVKQAFNYEFVDEKGDIKSDLQGIYVLSLYVDVLTGDRKVKAEERLLELIHKNEDKLDTGFLSVPFIMDVLTNMNRLDVAYRLLFNESCPSWLYEVKMGATSIWESWQAILPNKECSFLSMNHYAFGCIGDWLYRNIAGIKMLEPGYSKIRFSPNFDHGIAYASGAYESVLGMVKCEWKKTKTEIHMEVTVPVNAKAEVLLQEINIVERSNLIHLLNNEKGVNRVTEIDHGLFIEIGSGSFSFDVKVEN